MRLLEFPAKAPPGSALCPLSHPERGQGVWTTLSCGLLGPPQLFWVTPCGKQERGGCVGAQGGTEGEQCHGILVQLYGWHSTVCFCSLRVAWGCLSS